MALSRSQPEPLDACPFIDADDLRCDRRFRLSHLSEALGVCVGGYRSCRTYWRLLREQPARRTALTVHGQPLQPTGS
jgi:hypothetical protein